MKNNWEPRVGQKVVCIDSAGDCNLVKGKIYIVGDFKSCPHCDKAWVGYESCHGGDVVNYCPKCNGKIKLDLPLWYSSVWRFAPVIEQYADMTSEIAKEFQEHPDTVDQPVKVLEVQN